MAGHLRLPTDSHLPPPVGRLVAECHDLGLDGMWWRAYRGTETFVALFPLEASEAQVRATLNCDLGAEWESPMMWQDLMTVH
jgi:hypothetical protein